MEMEYNIFQPEIEATDPKILKAQKQTFALGLSGLLNALFGFVIWALIESFVLFVWEWLFEKEITSSIILLLIESMPWVDPGILGIVLGAIGIAKGKKLKKVGQLKDKSAIGYVFAYISVCWGVTVLFFFVFTIAAFIFTEA